MRSHGRINEQLLHCEKSFPFTATLTSINKGPLLPYLPVSPSSLLTSKRGDSERISDSWRFLIHFLDASRWICEFRLLTPWQYCYQDEMDKLEGMRAPLWFSYLPSANLKVIVGTIVTKTRRMWKVVDNAVNKTRRENNCASILVIVATFFYLYPCEPKVFSQCCSHAVSLQRLRFF